MSEYKEEPKAQPQQLSPQMLLDMYRMGISITLNDPLSVTFNIYPPTQSDSKKN